MLLQPSSLVGIGLSSAAPMAKPCRLAAALQLPSPLLEGSDSPGVSGEREAGLSRSASLSSRKQKQQGQQSVHMGPPSS